MPPKEEKSEKKGGLPSHSEAFAQMAIALIALALIGKIASRAADLLSGRVALDNPFIIAFLDFYEGLKGIAVLISAILICIIIPIIQKITAIRTEERKLLYPAKSDEKQSVHNPKWQRVIDHLESDRSADWKLAILEADIMLADLLEASGYEGESIGEKLKKIEKSDFNTIEKAWEAHKVRNLIAHEGADYVLTQHEAIRIIELYKAVFEEFYYI